MQNNTMLSFHRKPEIKEQYLQRLQLHYKADEIVQGHYWQNGKGCAVGCTIHGAEHSRYETELGIPRILARLEDRIFEGLTNAEAKEFPLQFLQAIPVGVDLKNVWRQLMIWLLIDPENGVIKFVKDAQQQQSIKDVAAAFELSMKEAVPAEKWIALRDAAWKAYRNAAYADAYAAAVAAADAAADAAAAAAAADDAAADAAAAAAAAAAAYAAAYAAYAAAYAADAAADAADAADADDADARRRAKHNYYSKIKTQLLHLLSSAA